MRHAASVMLSFIVAVSCLGQTSVGPISVSLEAPAKVGLPVWLKISSHHEIRYPFYVVPDFHACYDVEVRKNGNPFPRIRPPSSALGFGIIFAGNICGFLSIPGKPEHPNSIPIHLMYRFEQPGIYEVRYVERTPAAMAGSPTLTSPWATIEIQPGTSMERSKWLGDVSSYAPSDVTSLLSGYLPDILGVPDEQSLRLVVPYLNHPDPMVRQYVSNGLAYYWPGEDVKKAVLALFRKEGPSEESARLLSHAGEGTTTDEAESAVRIALPYLKSDSAILLKGAIDTVYWIAFGEKSQISAELKTRAGGALIDAKTHVVALGDQETTNAYAAALGTVRNAK